MGDFFFFVCVCVCVCSAPQEAHMAGFAPYFKPSYGWEPVPSSYKLRQMSFSPTVLQHTSNLYGPHISRSPQPQQPLDCSTHYSPALENYHCIACEKVRATSLFLFVASRPHRSEEEEKNRQLVRRLR